jgi:hypothetical protein
MAEGIELPAITPDPPKASPGDIQPGAKLHDGLIAKMNMVKVMGLLDIAYQGLRFSYRTDIGLVFHKFQQHVDVRGYTLRELMLKRGWMSYPPLPLHRTQPQG